MTEPLSVPASASADVRVNRIRDLLAALEPVLPGEKENSTAIELLQWWAEIDPVAAIVFAHANPALHGREELAVELFIRWLDARGAVGIGWASALPHGELRSRLWPTVISLVAETRPREALAMASELEGENRRRALSAIFAEWSSVDPERAMAEAQTLTTTEERSLATNQVIARWADHDLAAAVAWVKRLPPPGDPGSIDVLVSPLEILLEKWTAQMPIDAARYLVSLPDGPRRIHMLSTTAGQWAQQHPREALTWAAGLAADFDRTVALGGVLSAVAESDAAGAANLALTLAPGADQQKSFELIIDQWSARAPDQFTSWATAQLSDPSRHSALPAIVTAWAGADLPTLGDWLTALPPGNARDSSVAALARHLGSTEPELARSWAARIDDQRLREQQLTELERMVNRTSP
jgi:hypothetical protein